MRQIPQIDLKVELTKEEGCDKPYASLDAIMSAYGDHLGRDLYDHPQYCGDFYTQWEIEVVNPALIELGLAKVGQHMSWMTGERDSFGPLSRYVNVYVDEQWIGLTYG